MASIEKHTTQWLMSDARVGIDETKEKVVRQAEEGFDVILDWRFSLGSQSNLALLERDGRNVAIKSLNEVNALYCT